MVPQPLPFLPGMVARKATIQLGLSPFRDGWVAARFPFDQPLIRAYSRCAQILSKEMQASSPTSNTFLLIGQLSVIFTSVSPTRTW